MSESPRSDGDVLHLSDAKLGQIVFEFAERAQSALSLTDLEDDLADRLKPFGVAHFIHCEAMDRNRQPSAALLAGRSNPAWRKHYLERGMPRDDQLMHSGLASPEPTTWRRFRRQTRISRGQQQIFDEATEFRLKDGFFLPIHQLDGSVTCVSLFSERPLADDARTGAALHMMSIYYSFAVRRLLQPPEPATPRITMTPRQRECLQWVRAGKSDWEISQILGISEHTVAEHIDHARRRLGVKSRTQAVIEAISQGLIHI